MPDPINQPDIEIYVKDTSFSIIQDWLAKTFEPTSLPNFNGKPVNIKVGEIPVMITPNAAGKSYTSIWFQSNKTPWKNDEECGTDFLAFYDTEVRCSANSWQEEEEEQSEQWISMTRNEKKLILWG